MASDHKADKKAENYYSDLAAKQDKEKEAAIAKAEEPDPLEAKARARVGAISNWEMGVDDKGNKVPFDIRNNPDQIALGLFHDSLRNNDAGRVGRGFGSLESNANPNFVASVNKQNELRRREAASQALSDTTDQEISQNRADQFNLANMGNNRTAYIAGLRNSDSESAYNRGLQAYLKPKKPGFLDTLGSSFAQSLGHSLGSFSAPIPGGASIGG